MNLKSLSILNSVNRLYYDERKQLLGNTKEWVKKQQPSWEYNKFGIAAAGILIQVIVAGVMIGIWGMAGGSLWVAGVGVFFAFMANSIAFAQAPANWVISMLIASLLVNTVIMIYYIIQLL